MQIKPWVIELKQEPLILLFFGDISTILRIIVSTNVIYIVDFY